MIQLETNQKKERCFQLDHFLGSFNCLGARRVLEMHGRGQPAIGWSEAMRESQLRRAQKASFPVVPWVNLLQLRGWSQGLL